MQSASRILTRQNADERTVLFIRWVCSSAAGCIYRLGTLCQIAILFICAPYRRMVLARGGDNEY